MPASVWYISVHRESKDLVVSTSESMSSTLPFLRLSSKISANRLHERARTVILKCEIEVRRSLLLARIVSCTHQSRLKMSRLRHRCSAAHGRLYKLDQPRIGLDLKWLPTLCHDPVADGGDSTNENASLNQLRIGSIVVRSRSGSDTTPSHAMQWLMPYTRCMR